MTERFLQGRLAELKCVNYSLARHSLDHHNSDSSTSTSPSTKLIIFPFSLEKVIGKRNSIKEKLFGYLNYMPQNIQA